MTTIDLHPEDMLDAARRGTLAPNAEADLRAHLGRCAACRLSLTLPDDLRVEAASAATSADAALLARMVRGAMAEEPRPHRVPGPLTLRRLAIGLALLLVGGSAGAGVWANRDSLVRRFAPEIVPLPRAEAPRAPARLHAPPPAVAPVVEVAPAPVAPARPTRRLTAATPPASADELFADANRARRAGDDALALRRYAELRRAFPGSREELTARVVAADLLLGQGSPREALASFDSYLAANPDGTLSEEALVGRALALQRLGRRAEEREAWTQVLGKYPDSVQGARARGRLAELR